MIQEWCTISLMFHLYNQLKDFGCYVQMQFHEFLLRKEGFPYVLMLMMEIGREVYAIFCSSEKLIKEGLKVSLLLSLLYIFLFNHNPHRTR